MHKSNVHPVGQILLSGFILLSSACSLDPPGRTAQLEIDLSQIQESRKAPSLLQEPFNASLLSPSAFTAVIPPATASLFNCMMVNVVGPGIPRDPQDDDEVSIDSALNQLRAGSFCTYLGAHVGPFAGGTQMEASLTIPSGAERFVQVIGIRDQRVGAPACGAEFLNETDKASVGYFEISRAKVDLFSDQSVTMVNQYDGASDKTVREVRCGNVCNPFFSSGEDATQYTNANFYLKVVAPAGGVYLKSIKFKAAAVSGTVTLTAKIYTDSSNSPGTTTHTATTQTSIGTTVTDVFMSMYNSATQYLFLTGGTTYWVKIEGDSNFNLQGGTLGAVGDLKSCTGTDGSLTCSTTHGDGTDNRAFVSMFSCD